MNSGKLETIGVYQLEWTNITESIACGAQAIITNGTDHVWVSCGHYIARGRLIMDQRGNPMAVELDQFNLDPLKYAQHAAHDQREGTDYAHISDGDYVVLRNDVRELWFGLEGGAWPRILRASIIRFDPDTLAFKDIHVHPVVRTMPWVAFDSDKQVAYSANWTENDGKLISFDASKMEWIDRNISIEGLPLGSQQSIDFIQGADMISNSLFLMADDHGCTLLEIEMSSTPGEGNNGLSGYVLHVTHLGLGQEREGIALLENENGRWLLSLSNNKNTWEGLRYAEIDCVSLAKATTTTSNRLIGFVFLVGVAAGFSIFCLVRSNRAKSSSSDPTYGKVESGDDASTGIQMT